MRSTEPVRTVRPSTTTEPASLPRRPQPLPETVCPSTHTSGGPSRLLRPRTTPETVARSGERPLRLYPLQLTATATTAPECLRDTPETPTPSVCPRRRLHDMLIEKVRRPELVKSLLNYTCVTQTAATACRYESRYEKGKSQRAASQVERRALFTLLVYVCRLLFFQDCRLDCVAARPS